MTAGTEYLFEQSLEHPLFPYMELAAVSRRFGDSCERLSSWLSSVNTDRTEEEMQAYSSVLAFTFTISRLEGRYASWKELREGVSSLSRGLSGKTACVRVASREAGEKGRRLAAEKELGKSVAEHCAIRLENPDIEIRVLVSNSNYYLTTKVAEVDRKSLDSRQVKYRAFFSPISLSPRYARGLLNLCGVSKGKRVLDPFCGTGGILMEAVLLGASTVGSDIDPRMVEGTRRNFLQLGMKEGWELQRMDVGDIERLGEFDSVVTDPPYGRSSFANREDTGRLQSRAIMSAYKSLKEGGTLGIVVPDTGRLPHVDGLVLETHLTQRVHRSLVRNYLVYRKEGKRFQL